MPLGIDRLIDGWVHRRALARWGAAAARAETVDLETLRRDLARARQLRRRLDRLVHVAEGRLALPYIGSNAMRRPLGADWLWRPELWRGPLVPFGRAAVENRTQFGGEATIFHDCAISELTFRQIRNTREDDLAPFGVRLDVFRFDGSFLSLVLELPPEAVQGLTRRHLVRFDCVVELEKPLEMFVRLNIRHGPNTEQLVRELPMDAAAMAVDFDLAYSKLNEKRVEKAWVDIIFEGPELNQITLRDVTMSRRPRAEL
jgi:hypothetical protein